MQRLRQSIVGAAVAAVSWYASQRELLREFGDAGFGEKQKSYVGLHTPDSDAVRPQA